MKTMMVIVLLFNLLAIAGCGDKPGTLPSGLPSSDIDQSQDADATLDTIINYCSKLDFKGMEIPSSVVEEEIIRWTLALNISGSFEGPNGWKNITNNFDDTGLSLGLLNQTLGTGSLQPLLISMHEIAPQVLKSQFERSRYTSLISMLNDWSSQEIKPLFVEELYPEESNPYNEKDLGVLFKTLSKQSQNSVNWAIKNVYQDRSGLKFKPEWKKELQSLAQTPEYRNIQLAASFRLHQKALDYMSTLDLKSLNAYLFLFDINVQNGGLYRENFSDYRSFLSRNPRATEAQKLNALLQSRLKQVRDQFKEDVKARKTALINLKGRVHSIDRDFRKEYCF